MSSDVASAYSVAASGWERGPALLYARMAASLVLHAEPLLGMRALDVGTGSGVAAQALQARGAQVVATDLTHGMLVQHRLSRPACAVADVTRLPLRPGVFDVVVAAFVLNHLEDPAHGLREMARVCRPGGVVLASSFAASPDPEAKTAVESVAASFGWQPPSWYTELKASCGTALESVPQMLGGLQRAHLSAPESWVEEVSFADLSAERIAAWRLWAPALAPFVAALPDMQRTELLAAATSAVLACPPVTLQMLVGRGVAA